MKTGSQAILYILKQGYKKFFFRFLIFLIYVVILLRSLDPIVIAADPFYESGELFRAYQVVSKLLGMLLAYWMVMSFANVKEKE